jgi:hypothetical protein
VTGPVDGRRFSDTAVRWQTARTRVDSPAAVPRRDADEQRRPAAGEESATQRRPRQGMGGAARSSTRPVPGEPRDRGEA